MAESRATDRSGAGLRDVLFGAIDDLMNDKIDHVKAKAVAALATVLIKTVEVQLQFETLRLSDKIPAHLGPMQLVPPLDQKK